MKHGDISNKLAEALVINVDSVLLIEKPGFFKKPILDLVAVRVINNLAKKYDYRIILVTLSNHYKKIERLLDKYVMYNEFIVFKDIRELAEWLDIWDIHNYIDSDVNNLAAVFPRGILYSGSFKDTLERLK